MSPKGEPSPAATVTTGTSLGKRGHDLWAQIVGAPEARRPWTPSQRILFRFAFAYLALYCLPAPLDRVPLFAPINGAYGRAWGALVVFVGTKVLRLPYRFELESMGSADNTAMWISLLCVVSMSLAATLVWSLLDRRRVEYAFLYALLRAYSRYILAFTMIGYGLAKRTQFPPLQPEDLVTQFGRQSPMGLLWRFMGYSAPYAIFTGGCEILGGVLLLWRRTSTLGALVCVGVTTNVVMLNLCYDVPVKLLASNLLGLSLFLLLPDAPRLLGLFVLGRPATLSATPARASMKWTKGGLKLGLVSVVTLSMASDAHRAWLEGAGAPAPALYGVFDVVSFRRAGADVPPLATDTSRWRLVTFNRGYMTAHNLNDSRVPYRVELDDRGHLVTLVGQGGDGRRQTFSYEELGDDRIVLHSTSEDFTIELSRVEAKKLLLTSRGFHWISEVPYNR